METDYATEDSIELFHQKIGHLIILMQAMGHFYEIDDTWMLRPERERE